MRHLFLKVLLPAGILLPLLSGCFGPALRKVEDHSKPINRPLYSVLPPSGEGWVYMQDDHKDGHSIIFFKTDSPTHSIVILIQEVKAGPRPSSPDKFLEFIEADSKKIQNSARFKEQSMSFILDDRFGSYTVRASFQHKDYEAINRGDNPFLVYACHMYLFFHPREPYVLVKVEYSERGKTEEINNKNLERDAEEFSRHISLAK